MYSWGDKLLYRNEFECLFIKYSNTKESAYVLLKGHSSVSIADMTDLKKI